MMERERQQNDSLVATRCAGAVHSLSGPKKGDCWMRADVVLAQVSRGLQLQSPWVILTAAVS